MLSGPPETATAISGRGSNPPIAASAAANSRSVNAERTSAAETFAFGAGVLLDRRAGVGKLLFELGEGDAGALFLVGAGQRHAELQQVVGRLGALGIALVAIGIGRS